MVSNLHADVPVTSAELTSLFSGLPNAEKKPSEAWVSRTLRKVVGIQNPKKATLQRYAALPSQAVALSALIIDNADGFRTRLTEFGLRFVDFMPNELYVYDQISHLKIPSPELKSFSNVKVAADEVLNNGNFLKILDFPWDDFVQHGDPTSADPKTRGVFFREFIEKPYHRILTTSPNNRNRKRGAWVLRNFLCDDLTPTNISRQEDKAAAGSQPVSAPAAPVLLAHGMSNGATLNTQINLHATQKSCAMCHWKLDYVSGFFRYLGTWGKDFRPEGRRLIYFAAPPFIDKDYDDFMAFWKRPDGTWNLGVRRGMLEESPKDWHASDVNNDPVQTDLMAYLKIAPEFHRCLSKKLANFYINDNLSYDSKWLNLLAEEIPKYPESQSGTAMLKILGRLVFSEAYQLNNPDPKQCYDLAPGELPSEIPCAVNQVLETKCMSCHQDDSTNLRFKMTKTGKKWLDHTADDGSPLSPEESLKIVRTRITTENADERMPMGQAALPAPEQKMILDWLTQLKAEGK